MTTLITEPVELHLCFKPRVKQLYNFASLLLVLTTMVTFCFSNSLFAGARLPDEPKNVAKHSVISATTDTDKALINLPVVNLPVIKLKQTNSLADIIKDIENERVVLVGETHTRYDHHLVQLEVLKLLYQKSANLAIGVEWFQRPFQEHLDAYIAGKITEQEMLKQTGYFDRWRYDYRNYRPILHYARAHKIPVIALNSSQELNYALSKSGFDELPAELKVQLPESYDWSDKAYEQRLRMVFEEHQDYLGEFEDFLRGQLTWDESMAERAAQYLKTNPENRLLILAGSGHIVYGSGIPNRIKRRINVEQVSILVSEDLLPASENIADFLVLSQTQSLEPAGFIGAMLATEGKLVTIMGFSDDSAIKDAGVEEGAVIISVDDITVESFADFKLVTMNKKPGDSVEINYLENADDGSDDIKTVTVKLR